jgi:hypothetical protein
MKRLSGFLPVAGLVASLVFAAAASAVVPGTDAETTAVYARSRLRPGQTNHLGDDRGSRLESRAALELVDAGRLLSHGSKLGCANPHYSPLVSKVPLLLV